MANSLTVEERSGFGIATVMGRKAVSAASLGSALGFAPPEGPVRIKHDGLAWIGTGPATWLAMIFSRWRSSNIDSRCPE